MKKRSKLSRPDMIALAALVLALVATTLFVVSFAYTAYAVDGLLVIPQYVLVIANVAAVGAAVISIYALMRKGSKKFAVTALVLGLFVVSFPYLAVLIAI